VRERLRRFLSPEGMVAPERRLGALPDGREAYGRVMHIALPAIAEMVLMSLIGSMDTIMVGQLGKNALAAVSLPTQPRMMMLALFFSLNVGVTAIVARRKGQGRQKDANKTLRNALVLCLGLSVVIAGLAIAFAEPLMRLAGGHTRTPDDARVLKGAVDYYVIMAIALPVNALSMCINAALRGVGETRTPMRVNIIANLVNVVFNYLLIFGRLGFPRLEIRGAAIASVIGMAAGMVLAFRAVMRADDSYLHISLRDSWRLDREIMGTIVRVGGNAVVEQASMRVGFFLYSRIVYSLGVTMFAAHNIAMQFLALTFNFADGLAVASTTLVGQNLGRERKDLSLMYGKITQRIALFMSLALGGFTALMRYPVGRLFIDATTPDAGLVITYAAETLLVVALMQPVQMGSIVYAGCLRGAGDNLYVAAVMMVCVSIIRPIAAYLAVNVLQVSLALVWLISLAELVIRLYFFHRRFEGGKWAHKRV
jgi:putative MATE family efflux protein